MNPRQHISFHVEGTPITKGSAMAFIQARAQLPILAHTIADLRGKVRAVITQKHKDRGAWEKAVRTQALKACGPIPEPGGWFVDMMFYIPRPKSHYGTGRNAGTIKESAPRAPIGRTGDVDKLARSVLDALTGVLWNDDCQVQGIHARKSYSNTRGPGVTVCAEYLGG